MIDLQGSLLLYYHSMPLTKQAIKKMRHDKTVTERNQKTKETIKKAVKAYRKNPTEKGIQSIFSILDKAAKKNFFHKNKSSRLKSRLAKLLSKSA